MLFDGSVVGKQQGLQQNTNTKSTHTETQMFIQLSLQEADVPAVEQYLTQDTLTHERSTVAPAVQD